MCGGYSANPHYCLEGSTQPIRYSLPGWLVDGRSISEGILSFVEYAPRLRIVLPSRQIRITRLAEILKSKLKILIKSLLKKRDKKYIPLERKWIGPYGEQIYPCTERMCDAPAIFFAFRRYFELYFVFLMSSGRLVGLFTGSPEGSQGNKRTWLPGMAASQTYKGRHKEAFWSRFHVYNTTDIQDLTDANHERKRAYPFNLCYLCSNK